MGWKTVMKQQKLVEKMTIEEKAAILSGKTVWQTREIDRLSIPSIFLSDGPHGIRKQAGAGDHLGLNASLNATCFPTAATIANSWNQDLGEEIGQALGEEAASMDVNILLGPGLKEAHYVEEILNIFQKIHIFPGRWQRHIFVEYRVKAFMPARSIWRLTVRNFGEWQWTQLLTNGH